MVQCQVAGVSFHPAAKLARKDQPVRLERDSKNAHDHNAVVVLALIDGTFQKVGHLPKTLAMQVKDDALPAAGWIARTMGEPYYGITISTFGQQMNLPL
jgi:hypothetical protein